MQNNLEKKWQKIAQSEATNNFSDNTPFLLGNLQAASNEKESLSSGKMHRLDTPKDPRLPQDPRLAIIQKKTA